MLPSFFSIKGATTAAEHRPQTHFHLFLKRSSNQAMRLGGLQMTFVLPSSPWGPTNPTETLSIRSPAEEQFRHQHRAILAGHEPLCRSQLSRYHGPTTWKAVNGCSWVLPSGAHPVADAPSAEDHQLSSPPLQTDPPLREEGNVVCLEYFPGASPCRAFSASSIHMQLPSSSGSAFFHESANIDVPELSLFPTSFNTSSDLDDHYGPDCKNEGYIQKGPKRKQVYIWQCVRLPCYQKRCEAQC